MRGTLSVSSKRMSPSKTDFAASASKHGGFAGLPGHCYCSQERSWRCWPYNSGNESMVKCTHGCCTYREQASNSVTPNWVGECHGLAQLLEVSLCLMKLSRQLERFNLLQECILRLPFCILSFVFSVKHRWAEALGQAFSLFVLAPLFGSPIR